MHNNFCELNSKLRPNCRAFQFLSSHDLDGKIHTSSLVRKRASSLYFSYALFMLQPQISSFSVSHFGDSKKKKKRKRGMWRKTAKVCALFSQLCKIMRAFFRRDLSVRTAALSAPSAFLWSSRQVFKNSSPRDCAFFFFFMQCEKVSLQTFIRLFQHVFYGTVIGQTRK